MPVYLDRDGEFSKAHAVTTLPGLVVFRDGAVLHRGPTTLDAGQFLKRNTQRGPPRSPPLVSREQRSSYRTRQCDGYDEGTRP